jgi:hypothetical protein
MFPEILSKGYLGSVPQEEFVSSDTYASLLMRHRERNVNAVFHKQTPPLGVVSISRQHLQKLDTH